LPVVQHPVFNRPLVSTKLWRYTDIPKFIDLLTSKQLWLSNLEILAKDDPYEGAPGALQFPHRTWKSITETPDILKRQIIDIYGDKSSNSPEEAFRTWFMLQEQQYIYEASWRRQYFVNCWHASSHESVAMWKIYGSPGSGVAIVTNGARIETALSSNEQVLYLGEVKYEEPDVVDFGRSNSFQSVIVKRVNYRYEHEVRLVYYNTDDMHDPLEKFSWNEEIMRFDDIIEDIRPISPGISLQCDVDVLIERVIISPEAPRWYLPMIERLRDSFGFKFPVEISKIFTAPRALP